MRPSSVHATEIRTTEGTFVARFSDRGLVSLDFPSGSNQLARPSAPPLAEPVGPEQRRWRKQTFEALEAVLHGRKPVALPPLDWSQGTEFQRQVWAALLRIDPGETQTYADIAHAIGHPRAVRAVGGACGANPIPVLVPCHRVVAAGGRLGGFSGGLDWKRRLLENEGRCALSFSPRQKDEGRKMAEG